MSHWVKSTYCICLFWLARGGPNHFYRHCWNRTEIALERIYTSHIY